MNNNSYITVLSTQDYLMGVLCLIESLRKTNTKYPISVLITSEITSTTEELLKSYGVHVIRKNKIDVPESIKKKNKQGMFEHWTNTFDKLLIFELTQFEKLVYLDSDMYIRNNIDELFERKNMSATIDRRGEPSINKDWIKLTSGLMVVEPKRGTSSFFIDIISEIESKRDSIGDQDILQEYDKKWSQKQELHLDVKYNMFFPHIDYYTKYCNYTLEDINVVHFIYNKKPFQYSKEEISQYIEFIESKKQNNYKKNKGKVLEDYISCGNKNEIAVLQEYFDILEDVKLKLK